METSRAVALAAEVRDIYIEASRWRLFDDTREALESLRADGWEHFILSNHVPELEQIVGALGLSDLIEATVCSARIGYEKPHPKAFLHARAIAEDPEVLWMIGDNAEADVRGAEALGIPAILVRRPPLEGIRYHAIDLHAAGEILRAETR